MTEGKKDRNQGEGDRESARRYNEATREYVESGGVEAHEQERREGAEQIGPGRTEAERRAAERAAEEDPAVHRDYNARK